MEAAVKLGADFQAQALFIFSSSVQHDFELTTGNAASKQIKGGFFPHHQQWTYLPVACYLKSKRNRIIRVEAVARN